VFQRQRKTEEAHALYEKVIAIWKLYLKQDVKEKLGTLQVNMGVVRGYFIIFSGNKTT
jgi:hypothetical protein